MDINNWPVSEEERGDPIFVFAHEFEVWLSERINSDEGVEIRGMLTVLSAILIRLRSELPFKQMTHYLEQIVNGNEQRIRDGKAFVDTEGNHLNVLTAEEKYILGTDKVEVPDVIPEDWA